MALSHCIVLLAISSFLGACVALSFPHLPFDGHHGIHGHRAIHSHHGIHGHHSRHGIRGHNDTQGWLSGSATFYGLPIASGPPDNGKAHNALSSLIHTQVIHKNMVYFANRGKVREQIDFE